MAQSDIHLRFAWQAWHSWQWVACLGLVWARRSHVTPRHFAWQAWHKLTSTIVSRGRRGTNSHPPSFRVAGVAQTHIHLRFAWQAWHNLTSTSVLRGMRGTHGSGWHAWVWFGRALVARDAAPFCVAGVAQTHIHHRFAWQAWHKLTSTFVSRGRRATNSHPPSLRVAGVAQSHIHKRFAWQAWHSWHWVARLGLVWAWHNLTSTIVSRGRRRTGAAVT